MSEAAVLDGSARWSLHQGEALAWLCSLPDGCADAIVTDPPYSSGGMFREDRARTTSEKYVNGAQVSTYAEFGGDNRDQRSFALWASLWFSEVLRVAKPGALLICFTDWRQLPTVSDAMQSGGWVWRGILPWIKSPGTYRPGSGFANGCEYVLWASCGPLDAPIVTMGSWTGAAPTIGRDPDKVHPTQKPEALLQALLAPVVAGGVVVDPFAGSGTTGAAALSTGRRFLGCELTPHYAAGARERLAACSALSTGGAARLGQEALFGGAS